MLKGKYWFAPIFAAMISGSALADVMRPSFSVLQLSPVAPHMGGEHWANPKDMPLGPNYGVYKGKLIFFEFMVAQKDFVKGMSFMNLKSKLRTPLPPIDRVEIDWEPHGHEGFAVPHYDIHLYFVSHEMHVAI